MAGDPTHRHDELHRGLVPQAQLGTGSSGAGTKVLYDDQTYKTPSGGGGSSLFKTVRVATTANGTLSTAFANGQVVDGVTLATGDRILLRAQSSATENGIYTVNASGAPTRATDYSTSADILGSLIGVEAGNLYQGALFINTNNTGTITVGATSIGFSIIATWLRFYADASITYWGSPNQTSDLTIKDDVVMVDGVHTPADLADLGFSIGVGDDLIVLIVNEKDGSTIQLHALTSTPVDIELVDQSGSQWKSAGPRGTFVLNEVNRGLASIVAAAAIANTETVVASASMPADSLQAGSTFRVKAYGRLTSGATPGSSIFRFRIGTTTLTGNIAATLTILNATLVTNGSFELEMMVTVRTAGAGGTAIGNVSARGGTVSAFVGDISAISATVAVDTTAVKLAELTYISGNAGSTATFENAVIELVRA